MTFVVMFEDQSYTAHLPFMVLITLITGDQFLGFTFWGVGLDSESSLSLVLENVVLLSLLLWMLLFAHLSDCSSIQSSMLASIRSPKH